MEVVFTYCTTFYILAQKLQEEEEHKRIILVEEIA